MPARLWHDRTAVLYDRPSANGVAFAEALETVSHDRLTRRRQRDWSGHRRLERACRTRFVCERGSRLMEETVMPNPVAVASEGLAWGFSSLERTPGDGLSVVLWVWPNATRRLPLGMRLWRKHGPSTDALAREWLRAARQRVRCRPDAVLCAAW